MASGLQNIETVESPFRKFVTTIGVFPTAFTDAMTYYECLAYLVQYMENTMIPVINENAEAVEELQEKYIELKTFVDTYFDNLDVQEEIDNKLDQMVEDGTLQEIITSYVQTNVTWTFDNVAGMKSSTNLIDGSYAKTLGYYNVNDGGESIYYIRTREESDTPDEMLMVAIGDDLVGILVTNGKINTAQCGIKADGVTDVTTALNNFFNLDALLEKTVSEGVYLISNTVYIKGIWRQDTGNNGQKRIVFDHATLKYTGTVNGYAVILYNMFKYKIDGLCISRDSTANKLGVIGVWHGDFCNFDVQTIDLTNDDTILGGRTVSSKAVEYTNFTDAYIKGQLLVHPVSPSYINCNNFHNSIFDGHNFSYCVMLYGSTSKQELNFYNCDLSYATSAVFYVDEDQTLLGKGSINCVGCYFDSNISIFAGGNKHGMEFNTLFGLFPALSNNEIVNVKYTDFIKNMNLCGFGQFGYNLPYSNINYCINGDLSYQTNQSGQASYLMGSNSSVWTKTYEDSNLAINGKCRKIKWLGTSTNASIIAESVAAPRTDVYSCFARLKVTSGSCTGIQLSFAGAYVTIDDSELNGECLIVNSKNTQVSAGGSLNFSIIFMGASSDLEAEIYEVGVTEGKLITPNMPLHASAKLSS